MNAIAAELRKTATLPATFAALAVALLGPVLITLINAVAVRHALVAGRTDLVAYTSPVEAAFSAVPLGTVGAVILGVVAISSEYTSNSRDAGGGRQITATLTAAPRRARVLAAKAVAVLLLVAAVAATAIPASLALAYAVIGDAAPAATTREDVVPRALGAALYWALTGLIALSVTVVTRSGVVPLIVLIANSSLVSVSLLLSNLTPLARYLPDLAGIRLFARDSALDDALDPLAGGLVMAAWTIGALAVAGAVLHRRDA
jgi:hypothetical protein